MDDQSADGLAAATLYFQVQYDFDLVKVTPASSFCLKDWGAEDQWKGNTEGTRDYTRRVITDPGDWSRLHRLDPRQGHLGAQIQALQQITQGVGDRVPVLQTIFSPLAQAKNLVGGDELLIHLHRYPSELHEGLKIITDSILDFLEEAAHTGIAGIFYAIQHAQYSLLTEDEFTEFGQAYDLLILEAARRFWLNMAHLHGSQVMFDRVASYPIQALNWHDRDTEPDLEQAAARFPGLLCGGLSRWRTMVLGDPSAVRMEIRQALEVTGGRRLIVGTGCVLPIIAPQGNILSARQGVEP